MVSDNQTARDDALVEVYGNLNLPEGKPGRPLVTFALFAYNQEKYIRAAVEGALAQTYEPLEIIVSDDCSSDRTFEVIKEVASEYSGKHLIKVRRNRQNLGLIGHVNSVACVASADFIVAGAGDDISCRTRVEKILPYFLEGALLVHSDFSCIDDNNDPAPYTKPIQDLLTHNLNVIAGSGSLYLGATGAWHKELFRVFGPIEERAAWEDLVLGFRAAILRGHMYCPDVLVQYRITSGITSEIKVRNDLNRMSCAFIASLRQRLKDLAVAGDQVKIEPVIISAILVTEARINIRSGIGGFLVNLTVPMCVALAARLPRFALRKMRSWKWF